MTVDIAHLRSWIGRSETSGDTYKVFTLTSLLSSPAYTVHVAKMSCDQTVSMTLRPPVVSLPILR